MTSTEQQDPCLKFSQVWYDVTLVQASWENGARGWPKPSFDNILKICPASGEKKKFKRFQAHFADRESLKAHCDLRKQLQTLRQSVQSTVWSLDALSWRKHSALKQPEFRYAVKAPPGSSSLVPIKSSLTALAVQLGSLMLRQRWPGHNGRDTQQRRGYI